jgi:hypothetical protein
MDATNAGFGPDTSIGILPMPHVLLYYALSFGSGVRYHDCADADHRLGRGWRWTLPATLLLVFPPALEFGTGAFGFRDAWLKEEERNGVLRALGIEPDQRKRVAQRLNALDLLLEFLDDDQNKAQIVTLHNDLEDRLAVRDPN